jgi:hypothetical protein
MTSSGEVKIVMDQNPVSVCLSVTLRPFFSRPPPLT